MSDKQQAREKYKSNGTVNEVIKQYEKMSVQEYTSTLYDKTGKLLDDGIDLDTDKSYWESFIDPKQAAELELRLAMIESADFDWGSAEFKPMEEEDAE